MLRNDLKIRYQKPGNVYLGLIHRLDRPVGGAMVFAKTSKAASRLSDMFRRHVIERNYFAVVHGTLNKKRGQLVHYLHKDRQKNKVFVVPPTHPNVKKAVLDYEVMESKKGFSLLSVNLHTGRPHQIRIQLSTMGNPILLCFSIKDSSICLLEITFKRKYSVNNMYKIVFNCRK
ncbi:RluA family pseudouridine synthase [Bacillus timonensis]|uniref:RluA family pseudouridine synthase n=1 Tax=Bacillus timonensis TaxID=1033734 RepID=UPI003D6E311B